MKIQKRIALFLSVMLIALSVLTGCGGKKKEVSVDAGALAGELNACVSSDTLNQAEAGMIQKIYYIDEASFAGGAAWLSDGTTACEVAVIECKDASGASGASDKLKARVSSQKDLYASYNAEEAGRLDKAIIKTAGKYAVLAVVDDTAKAEEILKKAGF